MLRDLHIRNVAIIDEVHVEFSEELNLLTGETGAGKSIIIDSLGLVLGNRGSLDLIRTGATEASVEAVFIGLDSPEVKNVIDELGIDAGEELVLRRRLTSKGVSRAYINDVQVNLNTLRSLGQQLVTIHGQGEGDDLLTAGGQLGLFDSYAGVAENVAEIQEIYAQLMNVEDELASLATDDRARERELDLLSHQISEIESSKLDSEEESQLKKERQILQNSERIRSLGESSYYQLYDNEESVVSRMTGIEKSVSELAGLDATFSDKIEVLKSARYQLEDLASELRSYVDSVDSDPNRLMEIEQRLDVYRTMQRKYGATTEEVHQFFSEISEKYKSLQHSDERLEELKRQRDHLAKIYSDKAEKLSHARKSKIDGFCKDVENHLAEMGMEKARFSILLRQNPEEFTRKGIDTLVFLIVTNPGESPKPLVKVASGGEQSRIMLAIKSCTNMKLQNKSVIFDEVDSGIGGRIAEFIGRKLKNFSSNNQVICITHLPQIAVYGKTHLRVNKSAGGQSTSVDVITLGANDRPQEIARMLGGEDITDITLSHAEELLKQAQSFPIKENLAGENSRKK